jgi:DNA-binding LacI/PurR family transcriptional regulator
VASVRKIAERAGVSISTVSRALNNDTAVSAKTRSRILAIANSVGYVATVGRRTTNNIGLAFTGESSLADPFDSAVLQGVMRGLDEARFDLSILNLQRDKERDETYTQFFMRKSVRGVLLRTTAESRDVCTDIAHEAFPHVVISERFEEPSTNFIDGESRQDSERAVDYLIALGHRRIAFAMHNVSDRDHEDRFEGYRSALATAKIAFDSRLVFRQRCTLAGGATMMNLVTSMGRPPTAIYFADPLLAVGAVNRAHELGLSIPRELSVVGFDDTDARFSVHPTLTAVCQDTAALGFEAALWLTRRVGNGPTNGTLRRTLPTFFEINRSTAPPLVQTEGAVGLHESDGDPVAAPETPDDAATVH